MKKENRLPWWRTVFNDLYAVSIGWRSSKSLVICLFLRKLFGYFEWIFFSGIFMRQIVDGLDKKKNVNDILIFIAISGVVFCSINLFSGYAKNVTIPLAKTKLYGTVYSKIFRKAENVDLSCYEDPDFYNRYTMAIDGADEKILDAVNNLSGVIIGSVASCYVFKLMFEIDNFSALFLVFPLVGNFVFGHLKGKAEYKRYKEQVPNTKVINYVDRMMYLPDGAKEIRLSNIFTVLKKQYHHASMGNEKVAGKYAFENIMINFWRMTFSFTIMFEGILFYVYYRFSISKSVSLADVTIMTSLMVTASWVLINLFRDIGALIKSGIYMNNLRGFMEYKETISEDYEGEIPSQEFESLEFRNVSFAYKDKNIIENLSFRIVAGEKVALVGRNGAGKTTLIKLILRLYDPTEGMILYNGEDIRKYNLRQYRELFATTFQDFQIFGMSVKDNVLMGRSEENECLNVEKALLRAGIYEKVLGFNKGINCMMTKELDEEGVTLSGGENQKVAIARTFFKNSPIKIFDEPSSALDPIAEYELTNNIMEEGKDHTLLFISHRLSSVKRCSRVLVMEQGVLVEEGTHDELLLLNGIYAGMYNRQADNYLSTEI